MIRIRIKKAFWAWLIVVIISLLPVAALIFLGPAKTNLSAFGNLTHALGQISGLIGTTLFTLTFILSMRLNFIEEAFGGLDKVYKAHAIMGGLALLLILFHPLLLVAKFIPNNPSLAASYLLPGSHWSINLGVIALLGLLLLLIVTFFIGLKYNLWKLSHKLLGIIFILAMLHIFLVRETVAADYIFRGYYTYVIITAAIGIGAFLYSLFAKGALKRAPYTVLSIKQKNHVYDITLEPVKKALNYKAGQFVFLSFRSRKIGREYHPFSIACKTGEKNIRVVIKSLGDFTKKLEHVKKGDIVVVEGPYGRFNCRKTGIDQIWIAGGIGITPFIGLAEDFASKKPSIKVDLYYTVRHPDEFINLEEFKELENRNKNFRLFIRCSETEGRLELCDIESQCNDLKQKEFFICGPQGLKDAMISALMAKGVARDKIFSEEFNFK